MASRYIHATFVHRKNRFVASVTINKTLTDVYVPNTGRMSELALPGTECLLTGSGGKFSYKIIYMVKNNFPVMIDSTLSNALFAELLRRHRVPGLKKYTLLQREPAYGNHRFDYLIAGHDKPAFVELKSCTLFYKTVSSFPDAVSERASSHIKALASTAGGRLIILVLNDSAEIFVPNYHTDFNFYLTLKKFSKSINISALRICYDAHLKISYLTPVPVHIPEVDKSGFFFAVISSTAGDNYVYISESGSDTFTAVIQFKKQLSAGFLSPEFKKGSRVSDMPILGKNPDNSEINRLFSEKGGTVFSTDILSGTTYSFSYNPADKDWFWDYILHLRFTEYTLSST